MAKEAEQLTEDTDLGELYRAIVGEKTAVAEDSAVAQDVSGLAGPKVPVPDPGTRLRDRLRELGADQTDQSLVPARIPEAPPPLTNRARSQGLVVPAVGLLAIAGLVGLQLMEGPGVVPPERRPVEADAGIVIDRANSRHSSRQAAAACRGTEPACPGTAAGLNPSARAAFRPRAIRQRSICRHRRAGDSPGWRYPNGGAGHRHWRRTWARRRAHGGTRGRAQRKRS